jgi:hypothetical protein
VTESAPMHPESSRSSTHPTEATTKAEWHAPTMEEVDYSATEATGSGGVYDFTVYTGSTGP